MELREWQYMNKPAANSSGYKKRFEKLIKYHIDHASSELERIIRKDIKEDSFHLGEHYNTGKGEFDRDIIVDIDKNNNWSFSVFLDGKELVQKTGTSWEDLLRALSFYLYTPNVETPEYDELLTESLNEWHLMNPPKASQPTSNTQSQKYRYERLLAQIDADGISTYKVNKLDDTTLDITVNTKNKNNLNIKIGYEPDTDDYTFQVDGGTTGKGWDYEEDILPLLQAAGVITNDDLCESASSIADDFKLYENLWD
jgi:hypothetical protein